MNNYLVARYIKLYCNNIIAKCVANALQKSRLFLGVYSNKLRNLLAYALNKAEMGCI